MTYVTIPSSIKRIGKLAFQGCFSLKQIIFENESELELIDDYSFSCCALLNQISIPNSLKTIGRGAFAHCISLSNLKIEESSKLELIYFNSFKECEIFIDERTNKKLRPLIQNFSDKTFIISSEQNNLIPFYKINYPNKNKNYISFIGCRSVGKTSIIKRFISKEFDEDILSTVGLDVFDIGPLSIFDSSLSATHNHLNTYCLIRSYFIIILFDVSNRSSFDSLIDFKDSLNGYIQYILVGNKCDLDREVSREEAENIASQYNINYFEVSAKTGSGIDELFGYINSEIEVHYLFEKIEYDPPCEDKKNNSSLFKCSIF